MSYRVEPKVLESTECVGQQSARRPRQLLAWFAIPILVLALSYGWPALAQSPLVWQQSRGPYGGTIHSLAVDPSNPMRLLAGAASGLYASDDAGMTWQIVPLGDSSCAAISQIAYVGQDGSACYLATSNGVYASNDHGSSWQSSGMGAPVGPVEQIAVSPAGDRLYAVHGESLYVLQPGTNAWLLGGHVPARDAIRALAVGASNSSLIYLGTSEGVYFSENAGASWRPAQGLPHSLEVNDLALSGADRVIYVASSQGLYLSEDYGQSWSLLSPEPSDNLLVLTDAPNTVYANLGLRGVFVSYDAGQRFSVFYYPARPGHVWDVVIGDSQSGLAYVGTDQGVHMTPDGGDTWQASNNGLSCSTIDQIVDAPGDRDHLYCLVRGELFETLDGGHQWLLASRGAFVAPLARIAAGRSSRTLYALTHEGDLLQSTQGAKDWSLANVPVTGVHFTVLESIDASRSDRDVLLVGTASALWISLDGTETWTRIDTTSMVSPITATASLGGVLYAAAGDHVFESSKVQRKDDPIIWQCIAEQVFDGRVTAISTSAEGRGRIYAITDKSRIYRRRVGLSHWDDLSGADLQELDLRSVVAVPRAFRATAVCVLTDKGIWCSFDDGATWSSDEAECLIGGDATSLVVDDRAPQSLYVGTIAHGAYRGVLQETDLSPWILYGGLLVAGMALLALIRFAVLRFVRVRLRPSLLDSEWARWDERISELLWENLHVTQEMLEDVPVSARLVTMRRFVDSHPELEIRLADGPVPAIVPVREQELRVYQDYWDALRGRMDGPDSARTYALHLTEQLCDLLAFEPVESKPYQFLQGYMLRAPTIRLNLPNEFPVIFVLKPDLRQEDTHHVRDLMRAMNATSFFAILVVDAGGRQGAAAIAERMNGIGAEDFIIVDIRELANLYLAADPAKGLLHLVLEQIDLVSICPYVISGPVPDSMFFGRDYEIKAIMRTIRDRSYAIVGGRKIGKTSILTKVNRLLGQSVGYAPVYLDCQHIAHHEAFFEALESIEHVYAGARTPDYMRRVVVHLRQRYQGATLVFLMDEVDDLLAFDMAHQTRLFKVFRALSQEGVCRFVFCGQRKLSEALHDPESPLFNFCSDMRLGYLRPADTMRIITEPMAELAISYEDPELLPRRIIDLSSCHPNLVQVICRQLVARLNERGDRTIIAADLDHIRQSESFRDYFFDITWGSATALEKLITLLAADAPSVTQRDLARMLTEVGCEVTTRELVRALDTLVLLAVFRRQEDHYVFGARYFPKLIKQLGFDEMFRDSWIQACRTDQQGDAE